MRTFSPRRATGVMICAVALFALARAPDAPAQTAEVSSSASPSDTPMPWPSLVPAIAYGKTPVEGCPRFFIGLEPAKIDDCADKLVSSGWGLTAVTSRHDYTRPTVVDDLAGAFAPDSPKRWVERDDSLETGGLSAYDAETGLLVDKFQAMDHLIMVYQRGTPRACDDLTLYVPYELHVADTAKYFTTKMSERAASGCVPGPYYALIRRDAIQQENADEHVAFLPGDPHTTAAFWPQNDAERAAFEKRATARGFNVLSLDVPPDRWGKTAGSRYIETIVVVTGSSGFDLLKKRLDSASAAGERVVDLEIGLSEKTGAGKVRILWERAPKRTTLRGAQ